MNHKHNPFLSLVALLVLAVLLAFLVGCCNNAEAAESEKHRFTFTYDCSDVNNQAVIITDTETGAQYLYVDGYRAGAMVRLEPPVTED